MIFQTWPCDDKIYDELLQEWTDCDIAVDRLIELCRFYALLHFHLILILNEPFTFLFDHHLLWTPSDQTSRHFFFQTSRPALFFGSARVS